MDRRRARLAYHAGRALAGSGTCDVMDAAGTCAGNGPDRVSLELPGHGLELLRGTDPAGRIGRRVAADRLGASARECIVIAGRWGSWAHPWVKWVHWSAMSERW